MQKIEYNAALCQKIVLIWYYLTKTSVTSLLSVRSNKSGESLTLLQNSNVQRSCRETLQENDEQMSLTASGKNKTGDACGDGKYQAVLGWSRLDQEESRRKVTDMWMHLWKGVIRAVLTFCFCKKSFSFLENLDRFQHPLPDSLHLGSSNL